MGQGAGGNTKWLNGKHEGIYGEDGIRTDDALNGSTYNFRTGLLGHTLYDVIPYYWLGNNPDDPTTMGQRWWRTFKLSTYNGDVPESNSCACEDELPFGLRGPYKF